MRQQARTVERELARLATASHGVVTRRQLEDAGITPAEIRHRLKSGALLRVHRGVYRVGHRAASVEATYLAAVWACGGGAALSGRAAAHLLGIAAGDAPPPEVTAPTERRVADVATYRCRHFDAAERIVWRGVPVTSAARTVVDLAAVLDADALARVCHEAGIHHRLTPAAVQAVLARRPTVAGAAGLRRVMNGDVEVTLSTLERRFLERLRAAALPLPQTNQRVGRWRVDCRWPAEQLTVELDGYRFHSSRHAWERDRRREREARARGDEFRRYTYGDVLEDPRYMLAELAALLRPEAS